MITSVAAAVEPDTLWLGGEDPVTGLAVEGGLWDFEDVTQQGWTSEALRARGRYFRHVTGDSVVAHGDLVSPVITQGGSTGSIWCGAHEDEALLDCWPGGMGYSNSWSQTLERTFTYGGSGDINVSFDYFADLESGFDFVYVYLRSPGGGLVGPFNEAPTSPIGVGYTGSSQEGTALSQPTAPAHDSITIDEANLPGSGETFGIVFAVKTDPFGSDALSPGTPFVLDSMFGPFGVDNVVVSGVGVADTSDFEPAPPHDEYDGWVPSVEAVEALLAIRSVGELQPPNNPPECLIEGFALTASAPAPEAHPAGQLERLQSNVVPLIGNGSAVVLELDWRGSADPCRNASASVHYYPWTCPTSGAVGWTSVPVPLFGGGSAPCTRLRVAISEIVPALTEAESLRVVIDVFRDLTPPNMCDTDPAPPPPYWDNIRVGLVSTPVDAGDTPAPLARLAVAARSPASSDRAGVLVSIPGNDDAILSLYDVSGRLLARSIVDGPVHDQWFAWRDFAPVEHAGVYFWELRTASEHLSRRTVILE